MARGENLVVLIGNLASDIEVRYVGAKNTACVNIGIAVNEGVKNAAGEWEDKVHFFDLTFWGRTAEVLSEYCAKGSRIYVRGRLQQEKWEKEGVKHYRVRVVVESMQMLGSKKDGEGGGVGSGGKGKPQGDDAYSGPSKQQKETEYGGAGEDIPF